jgi:nicotinate-nucleotide pyrophosphorylase (carboxylating)
MRESDRLRSHFDFGDRESRCADVLIELALAEDLGETGDVTTTATIPAGVHCTAHLVVRTPGVVAGLPVAERLVTRFELLEGWTPRVSDGDVIRAGDTIATMAGSVRSILSVERVLLNFLQRLSGIATLTARYVSEIAGTRARILDTRKTTPGWRALEKYAVRCGGGANHRFGLFDAILIKDNHLAWLGRSAGAINPIAMAIAAAKADVPEGGFIEVEVDTLEQFDLALVCRPDIILVDNLGPEATAEAVRRRDASALDVLIESSGGVTLQSVRALAETGVDRISVGALTHSAPALDIALDFELR